MRDHPDAPDEIKKERQGKLAGLRDAIRAGVESGPGIPAGEVFDQLDAKYAGGGVPAKIFQVTEEK